MDRRNWEKERINKILETEYKLEVSEKRLIVSGRTPPVLCK